MKKRTTVRNSKLKLPVIKETPFEKGLVQNDVKKEHDRIIQNGLSEAIMGQGWGTPGWGTQLSQADTLFKNNRWYLVSNMRQLLSEIYVEQGLVQTVVSVPVDDGLRGGVEIHTKQLSEDEITELYADMEREDDIGTAAKAAKWNRLFGGGGIVIVTDQDPKAPFNIKAITADSPLQFRAVDMWELFWSFQNTNDYSAVIDAGQLNANACYNYYGVELHQSRVMRMVGVDAPSFIRPRLRGWGVSIVEVLVRSINQYLKANNLTFEVLDEFKVDMYKIKNLATTLMQAGGEATVQRRIQLANLQKNYQNAIVIDGEDDWDHKQLSFAGLSDVMLGIRLQVAADMRMPLTKIFGTGAQGFNSGEDDIEVYNSMVEAQVRTKTKYEILRMIEIRCQRKFNRVPTDLTINFKPMRVLSSEQEENVKTQKFNRLLQAKQAGEISSQEFKEGCNRDKLLSVQLDPTKDNLMDDDQGTNEEDDVASDDNKKKEGEAKEKPPVIPQDKQSKLTAKDAPELDS